MTLQPKDLMIGDLLTFEDCVKDGKIIPIEVVELHGYNNDFLASIDGDEVCDMLEFNDEIVGIPLTPEILEKNGFAKIVEIEHDCTYQLLIPTSYKDTPYSIQFTFCNDPTSAVNTIFNCWGPISSEGRGINDINMCNIESVHELQHVLKLCKIGKEIEL